MPLAVVFLLLGSITLPKAAMYIGFIYAAARLLYTIQYVTCGSNSRVLGAIGGTTPLYGLGIGAFVELIRIAVANN